VPYDTVESITTPTGKEETVGVEGVL